MLEFTFSVSKLVVLFTVIVVAALSIFAGASLVDVLTRTGSAMLSVGLLAWLFNWLIARKSIETVRLELGQEAEVQQSNTPPFVTTERTA
jgi:hypothetical protein